MLDMFKNAIFGSATNPVVPNSPKYKFNKQDAVYVLIHTGVLAGTTAITFLVEYASGIDAGSYTPIVILVANTVGQAALKWLKANDTPVPTIEK